MSKQHSSCHKLKYFYTNIWLNLAVKPKIMGFVCVADEVPGSAVLIFDIELVDLEEGLPEGYMFIWNNDVSPDLFGEMDKDSNKQVEPSEVRDDLLLDKDIFNNQ